MRKKIKAIIEATGVSIIKSGNIVASYDPNENLITLPTNPLFEVARIMRPRYKDFTLCHEIGHAVYVKFRIWEDEEFIDLFGDPDDKEYDQNAFWKSAFSTKSPDFATTYGQSHPIEDWADMFALFLCAPELFWESESQSVKQKKNYVKKVVRRIK